MDGPRQRPAGRLRAPVRETQFQGLEVGPARRRFLFLPPVQLVVSRIQAVRTARQRTSGGGARMGPSLVEAGPGQGPVSQHVAGSVLPRQPQGVRTVLQGEPDLRVRRRVSGPAQIRDQEESPALQAVRGRGPPARLPDLPDRAVGEIQSQAVQGNDPVPGIMEFDEFGALVAPGGIVEHLVEPHPGVGEPRPDDREERRQKVTDGLGSPRTGQMDALSGRKGGRRRFRSCPGGA